MGFRTPARFASAARCGLLGILCCAVAAAVIFLTGRISQASCGDYVVPRGSHLMKTQLGMLHHEAPQPKANTLATPLAPPCNSPACRGELPQLPVPQAPPNLNLAEKPLALFGADLSLEAGGAESDWQNEQEHALPGFRMPLERPPSL